MCFVGVYALESFVHCYNVGSFDFIVQDIVLFFPYGLEHDPHLLDEFILNIVADRCFGKSFGSGYSSQ